MFAILMLLLLQDATGHYTLTVHGGSGSGLYLCGEKVTIIADRHPKEVFSQWHAGWDGETPIDRVTQRKAKLTMPCKDVEVSAMSIAKAPRHR